MKNVNLVLGYHNEEYCGTFSVDFSSDLKDLLLANLKHIKEANDCVFVRLFDDCGKILGTTEK